MKIISKENRSIKSYKSSEYSIIIIICLYIFALIFFWLIVTAKDLDINIKLLGVVLVVFFFSFLCWFFNFEFEIYNTHFSICYGLVFLPFKIIFTEILFNNIDWIDGGKFEGKIQWGTKITIFEITFYLKSGKIKKYSLLGKESDFRNVIYNWRKIANYEIE
jgi:hypothetical protein